MTTNFGFSPGILDYWMLLADWRNGSFAILLAIGPSGRLRPRDPQSNAGS
jgi:hypothetical protein